jgi:hypothetical protein
MSLFSQVKAYLLENSTATNNPTSTTAPIVDDPPKCRFRLDTDSSDTLILPDGRKLGYAQYGSLTGKPILYQHGLPGSRLEAATYHDLGLELGARIISTDRPGIGWSSPHPNRKLLDHPKDLEHLANHLGLESYSVLVRAMFRYFFAASLHVCWIGRIGRWTICSRLRGSITIRKAKMRFYCVRPRAA